MRLTIAPALPFYLMLAFPPILPFLGRGEISKQAPLLLLISIVVFLFCRLKRIKIDAVFILLAIYSIYCFVNTFVKQAVIDQQVLSNDIFESLRVTLISLFYLYGYNFLRTSNSVFFSSVLLWKVLVLFSATVLVSYLARDGLFGFVSAFYNSESHRFSSLMPGINYAWFPLVTLLGIGIVYFNQEKLPPRWLLMFFLLSVLTLIMSASFTSILCFFLFCGIVIFLILLKRLGLKVFYYVIFFVITLIFLGALLLDYLTYSSNAVTGKFRLLILFWQTGDIGSFTSLVKRFEVWQNVIELVRERPITGYGANKSGLRYTDNTYVMTLYRYGLSGLLLEFAVYIALVTSFLSSLLRQRNEIICAVSLGVIGAYLLSGVAANSFYELKLPYVLFLLLGCMKYSSEKRTPYS